MTSFSIFLLKYSLSCFIYFGIKNKSMNNQITNTNNIKAEIEIIKIIGNTVKKYKGKKKNKNRLTIRSILLKTVSPN